MSFILQYMQSNNSLQERNGTEIKATCMKTDSLGVHECRYVQTPIERHRFTPHFVTLCEGS